MKGYRVEGCKIEGCRNVVWKIEDCTMEGVGVEVGDNTL